MRHQGTMALPTYLYAYGMTFLQFAVRATIYLYEMSMQATMFSNLFWRSILITIAYSFNE